MNMHVKSATLEPVEVHRGSPSYGLEDPKWEARPRTEDDPYDRSGYRQCSYCGSIHPEDMIRLLRDGGAKLEGSTKSYKRYLIVPNPIAGRDVKMGSSSGPVYAARFVGDDPKKPSQYAPSDLTDEERKAGRYSRDIRGPAPNTIQQKFYMEHTTEAQWQEVVKAARGEPA